MPPLKIADMTIADLTQLIQQVVKEQLSQQQSNANDARSVQEILASIDRHRWTLSPGTPTASQLIIEERNQWRQGL